MNWKTALIMSVTCLLVLLYPGSSSGFCAELGSGGNNAEQREFFEKHVRPLLAEHCYECHSGRAEAIQAGLRVDQRATLLAGGDSGPAVVPGEVEQSLLISAVRYESFEMPPRGRLTADQVENLERWVSQGAWWPEDEANTAPDLADANPRALDWSARKASHWAWQPLRLEAPRNEFTEFADTEEAGQIDRYILASLAEARLPPAPRAEPQHLVRRLYLDLVGLPPTPAEVGAFTASPTTEAYEAIVNRLLESPRFGEKWARHWLDLVRYAETCGHEFDYPIPFADRYRDYLIRALNADVPYDQLVREHVAGDLIPAPRRHPLTGANESIIGTGFWFLGEAVHAPTDVRGDEADRIDNQIDVFGKTFLAMTIACARCHDHKFDPIPTTDYYALAGFLQSSRRQLAMLDPHQEISTRTVQIGARREAGDRRLVAAVRDVPLPAVRMAEGLLAAESRRTRGSSLSDVQGISISTDASLRRERSWIDSWTAALEDNELQSIQHPLHAWRVLADSSAALPFEQRRQQLRARLESQQLAHQQAMEQMVPLADFRSGDYDNWFVTGWAFGSRPTTVGQWDGPFTEAQFTPPFVAHSGRFGARQYGVLRSPTFTLNHSRIHHRLLAKGVQIRLIVDGYVMDAYSELLFGDATLENVDTQGHFRWVTQQKDLDHYLGHRAHLEIVDQGDGFAAVDAIYFSNDDAPPEAVHPLNLQLSRDSGIRSLDDLAEAYAEALQQACETAGTSQSRDGQELLNWLLRWRLIKPDPGWHSLAAEVDQMQAHLPTPELVTALADGSGEDERLHIRGSHRNLGAPVPRRAPVVIGGDESLAVSQGSGRLQLADQLVARDNPLLARVIVNRLWHHLMGRGLVASVDDFGAMGQPPTHASLLDWLALDLMDHGWSLKRTIRQIVLSRTYQQSTRPTDLRVATIDPENQAWSHGRLRRMTAEQLRDAMLSISGHLDTTLYGPSVPVHLTPFMTGRGRPASGPLDGNGRRSIYTRVQRNFLSPLMLAFDMPSPFSTMGRRSVSNVPAQSLILMNDDFVWQQARRWARRLLEVSEETDARIEQAFLQAYARVPSESERARLREFIQSQSTFPDRSEGSVDVWTDICHALWNTKEFLYVY